MSANIAQFTNPRNLPEPDIYEAVYNFVLTYGLPVLAPENIFRGWQNRGALPAGTNEYAVISILNQTRVGTNVRTYVPTGDTGNQSEKTCLRCQVQVDFCSDAYLSRRRAQALETITRSAAGVQFFNNYGLSSLYAEGIRDLSYVDESDQFVQRHMVLLHLSYWSGIEVEIEGFDTLQMERIENVDVHHPPIKRPKK